MNKASSKTPSNPRYGLISYAIDKGGITPGSDRGPKVLKDRGLLDRLSSLSCDVTDLGEVSLNKNSADLDAAGKLLTEEEKGTKNAAAVYLAAKELSEKVRASLSQGLFPLVLGGDHSSAIGSVAGMSNYFGERSEKIGLIWVDTHPDINVPATSDSKCLFGMSAALATGFFPDGAFKGLCQSSPAVSPENIAYIGLRDVDPGEKKLIHDHNIAALTMKDIDIRGTAAVVAEAIEVASKGTAGFLVSFDLDACDPRISPGTQTPIRGGLTFREAHLILELLYESRKMLGFELVELNPLLDRDFQTADLALSLLESAVGKSIL